MRFLGRAAILLLPAATAPCMQAEQVFRIAGYLPEYRVAGVETEQVKGLTDLIVFSVWPKASGALDASAWPGAKLKKARRLARGAKARVLVAVGGWGRSTGFAEMTSREETRGKFAKELMDFCKANEMAGVVYDWEFPSNAKEETGMGKLLGDTRRLFEPSGRRVEIAVNPAKTLPREWTAKVDAVQVMSYDNGPRHSTYEQAVADLDAMARMGAPAKKLLLGLPFYGRGIANRDRAMTYAEIHQRFRPGEDLDEAGGFYFNGPRTLQRKVSLAKERGLGGVMIWEVGQDARGRASLLSRLTQAKKNP